MKRSLMLLLTSMAAFAAPPVSSPGKNPLVATSSQLRTLTRESSRSVVEIEVTGYGSEASDGNVGVVSKQQGLGSGVIIDPDGYIVTNAHVIAGAMDVKVLVSTDRDPSDSEDDDASPQLVDAKIVGVDRESDLALLKVNLSGLRALSFAPTNSLRQGDLVLAIGNPMGLRNSVSLGVVSATARAVGETNSFGYIQTDASINPGNSGGALIDADGRLVGVNTFILSHSGGNEGLGFAIPGQIVKYVVSQLRDHGRVERGEIGITLQDITPPLSSALMLPRARGVILADVAASSPAEVAGLRIGDILLSVDGVHVSSVSQFQSHAYARKPGEMVNIEYFRDGDTHEAKVEMRARHAEYDPLAALSSPEAHLVPRLGILGIEVNQQISALLPQLREQSGVIVATRAADGLGQLVDLQPGDVIHAINGSAVATLDFLKETISALNHGSPVALQIERDGKMQYVAFQLD